MEAALLEEEGVIQGAILSLQEDGGDASSSIARLNRAACTVRGRVFILANQGIQALVKALKASIAASTTTGTPLTTADKDTLELVKTLNYCCLDPGCAVALATVGGLSLIDRLVLSEHEEIQEAASEVVARCSSTPGSRRRAVDEEDLVVGLPWRIPMEVVTGSGDRSRVVLLLRQVEERMGGQADTGFKLWPAATILARWLATNSGVLRDKVVLELGAGLGLCGVLAGHLAKEVIITDYNYTCLSRLQDNVELNKGPSFPGSAFSEEGKVSARWLDWDLIKPVSPAEGGCKVGGLTDEEVLDGVTEWVCPPLDVVIGSDVICEEANAKGIARLLDIALKPGGLALITMPFPDHRYGVDSFPRHLADHGLHFQAQEVTDPTLLEGLEEASFMRFQLYHITRTPIQHREAKDP